MVQKIIIGTLGIWLMLSAIILQTATANIINFLIVGIISAIAGLTLTVKKSIDGWLGAVLGLWLIISSFIPFIETLPCNYCNHFLIGTIFIVLGLSKMKKEEDLMTPYNYNNKLHTHRY